MHMYSDKHNLTKQQSDSCRVGIS